MVVLSVLDFFFLSTIFVKYAESTDSGKHYLYAYFVFNQITLYVQYFETVLIHTILSDKYFKAGDGKNCHENQIIDTENKCKDAVQVLGKVLGLFYMRSSSSTDYPAGCYYQGYYGYFNEITDPSQTNPDNFDTFGGLCMEIGTTNYYYKDFS